MRRLVRRSPALLALPFLGAAAASSAAGGSALSVEILGGAPWNATTRLEIEQDGEPALAVDADWETRPFETPWYWALRIGLVRDDRTWSLDLLHHKIYLENPPAGVQSFSVSHGLNFLTVQRAWRRGGTRLHVAAGAILAHPESTVRGRTPAERGLGNLGYHLTGPAIGAGAGRRIRIADRISLVLEGRATAARVRVPVADGHARTSSVSLHLLAGLGFER